MRLSLAQSWFGTNDLRTMSDIYVRVGTNALYRRVRVQGFLANKNWWSLWIRYTPL
jgi:hypothetical protein